MSIHHNIRIFCFWRFSDCGSLLSTSFERDSRLRSIESYVLFGSTVKSIQFHQDVDFINGPAFSNISSISTSIQAGNVRAIVDSSFVLDSSGSTCFGLPAQLQFRAIFEFFVSLVLRPGSHFRRFHSSRVR
jgi:hypothetical protein